MSNITPILVTGSFTPGGTQDVRITAQTITIAVSVASLPLPSNAAQETGGNLAAIKADLDKNTYTSGRLLVDGSGVTQPVSGPLTDAQLRAIPVPISGTVSLTTESIEIGTVDQGTGGTSAWKVDGSAVVQPVSGTVAVSNFPASQSVTQGTSPWVISGAVTATQSGAWTTGRTWTLSSGTDSVAAIQSGTWNINNISGTISLPTGAATEATLAALNAKVTVVNTGAVTISTALPTGTNLIGHVITDSGSTTSVSNFPATQPISGTVTANQGTPNSAANKWPIEIVDSGGVNIAAVTAANALKVDGSTVTQPISASSLPLPTGAATEATLAGIKTDTDKFTFASARLLVDGSGVTQPVSGTVAVTQSTSPWVISGTVTANAGTNLNTSALALASTQTDRTQKTQITDGTRDGTIKAASTLPLATDTALVITQRDALPAGTNVIGHVITDSGSTTVVTGNVTVVQSTASNLKVDLSGTGANATAIKVDGSAVTQPISGTVMANAGTGTFQENVAQFGGTNVVTGTGASGAGIPRVTISNDSSLAANQSVNINQVGGSAITEGQKTMANSVPVVIASDQTAVPASQSGAWTVQPGNTPNTSPWLVEERVPSLATYSAAALNFAPAATPTDIFTIYGSGTKTIKILRLEVSATQNTAAIRDLVLIKRSATNTGGTSASVTAVPHDSNDAGATATVLSYTANPTSLGAAVGNIRTVKMDIPATNLVGSTDRVTWTFGDRPGQAIVLRGTSQGMAINLNSVTSGSNLFDISIEWSEE